MRLSRENTIITSIVIGLIVLHGIILSLMGRIAWCECGLGLWTSDAWGSDTSQHFADPYSTSHVLHGIIFYLILRYAVPKLSQGWRLIIAIIVEIGWEILENSPIIINRYREATAALGYTGDSILNSVGDVLCVLLGFYIAYKLPWKWTLVITIIIELIMLYLFRDNLTLNVVMLVYPIEAIKEWQGAR